MAEEVLVGDSLVIEMNSFAIVQGNRYDGYLVIILDNIFYISIETFVLHPCWNCLDSMILTSTYTMFRASIKGMYQKVIFLSSPPKHMLLVYI